jgi:hypothetical protein
VVRADSGDSVDAASVASAPPASVLSGNDALSTLLGVMDPSTEAFQFLSNGTVNEANVWSQHKAVTGHAVPRSWILLDNQSTVDVFCNKSLLHNIRKAPGTYRVSCNAGVVSTSLIGDLPGYPAPVGFHEGGIANILSLHRVSEHCRVEYDSGETGASFRVTKPNGSVRMFVPSVSGLHYCDTLEHGTVFINTVARKKEQYTVRAYQQAALARRIQDVIGRPSTRDYVKIVEGGMLANCPVSRADIKAAEDIFGPNLGS